MADADWENRGPDNCEGCAVACYSDELTSGLCGACKAEALAALAQLEAEGVEAEEVYDRGNADRSREYEPRRAFL